MLGGRKTGGLGCCCNGQRRGKDGERFLRLLRPEQSQTAPVEIVPETEKGEAVCNRLTGNLNEDFYA